ncbi:PKD domain-containing protein [Flavicella sediminum]|uniref:PKD domain-containing protein n=1 Tax=Flavicella sediminum TaxID=2585141 RepID=UPI0011245F28|nr:PKD domain-containing protein [Flavicella sediminum]
MSRKILYIICVTFFLGCSFCSFGQRSKEYKVYQFPKNEMPRIDGEFSDWKSVPDSYSIGLKQMKETVRGLDFDLDPKDYDVDVKVAWVKDLNRLYFYVESYDDFWDFEDKGLRQDIFEVVVDADLSGGPFIKKDNGNLDHFSVEKLHFKGHGSHAQNYHVFTPAVNKDPAMVWGNTPWIKDFPYFNIAYDYKFKHGKKGKLKMEFWITPFDHADYSGIEASRISQLQENEIIGLSWCGIDYDGGKSESFINLAHDTRMIRNASYLNLFRLMPLEKEHQNNIQADWSFIEIDRKERWIQFKDKSFGDIETWHWDFGDGTISNEKNPSHHYEKGGEWIVVLTISSSSETSVRSKVWEIVTE